MRVVGYVRLSRDEDKENYGSIIIQKKIIEEYAREQGWKVQKYYEDDNCSGYTFDRPAFTDLVKDLQNDHFDIIIAKDLSRIGRHNAYTLLFVEQVKRLNKRLVLPRESGAGYDTERDSNDMLGITTWYNEMYIKDISRKIKSSIKARQKEGTLLIREYYGYKRDQGSKGQLKVDEETADTIRLIFRLYISGSGYRRIADELNRLDSPTPSRILCRQYEQKGKAYKGSISDIWSAANVQRIIKNDLYTGTLRLAKTKKLSIKGKSIKNCEKDQFVFEDNHEAIISREDFVLVQQIAEGRNTASYRGSGRSNNVFAGLLYCSDCGSYMIANSRGGRPKYYICGSYHKHGNKKCTRHAVKENELIEFFVEHIKLLREKLQAYLETLDGELAKLEKTKDAKVSVGRLENELRQVKAEYKLMLSQKLRDLGRESNLEYRKIVEDNYRGLELDKKRCISHLEAQIGMLVKLRLREAEYESRGIALRVIDNILRKEKPDRRDLELLVNTIIIDKDGNSRFNLSGCIDPICSHSQVDVRLDSDL